MLNEVIPLEFPETKLTKKIDSTEKTSIIHFVISAILATKVEKKPIIIVLDMIQWLDYKSWSLLNYIAKVYLLINVYV